MSRKPKEFWSESPTKDGTAVYQTHLQRTACKKINNQYKIHDTWSSYKHSASAFELILRSTSLALWISNKMKEGRWQLENLVSNTCSKEKRANKVRLQMRKLHINLLLSPDHKNRIIVVVFGTEFYLLIGIWKPFSKSEPRWSPIPNQRLDSPIKQCQKTI